MVLKPLQVNRVGAACLKSGRPVHSSSACTHSGRHRSNILRTVSYLPGSTEQVLLSAPAVAMLHCVELTNNAESQQAPLSLQDKADVAEVEVDPQGRWRPLGSLGRWFTILEDHSTIRASLAEAGQIKPEPGTEAAGGGTCRTSQAPPGHNHSPTLTEHMVVKGAASVGTTVFASGAALDAQLPRQHRVTALSPCVKRFMFHSRPHAQQVFHSAGALGRGTHTGVQPVPGDVCQVSDCCLDVPSRCPRQCWWSIMYGCTPLGTRHRSCFAVR